jgi:beta-glucosidase
VSAPAPERSEPDIAALLDALTLKEQVSLLAGKDFWTTIAVERLAIPAIKVSDGPNGARGGGALIGGVTAAAFPVAIGLAATWNVELMREIGGALADEARSKGARVLLGPTVNMHRSPLNGRNFECYSEDPFLSSELVVGYIEGLQAKNVAATVKHFVANDSEYQRNTISSDVDARTLNEIYLPPFEAAVKRGKTWALMTSYNRLNGTYVSEQSELINGVLKTQWGFDGLAMSDWFGTQSTAEALNGGLDLEMPGPARHRGDKLLEAVHSGAVAPAAIREAARRLLRLIARVGAFREPTIAPERADNRPETRALIRRAGTQGIVLLKNEGILPLQSKTLKIAAIGPNAASAQIMGGGSAQLNPHYSVSPLDGLRAALPHADISHEIGCPNYRLVPTHQGETTIDFFEGTNFVAASKHEVKSSEAICMFLGPIGSGVDGKNCSARLRSTFTPKQAAEYSIGLVATGPARVFVDDRLVLDAWDWVAGEEYFGSAGNERVTHIALDAGKTYGLLVEYRSADHPSTMGITVIRLGVAPILGEAAIARAVETARTADVALLFVGLTGEWDGEGIDRPNMDLSGSQDELIARVAAVNANTIVVLQTGGPVAMPWLSAVPAVLEAWYPGQECGNAIADVLLGETDAGGRLPQTFPRRLEDNPAYINYPGENGRVRYGEGIFIGYRYYEKKKLAPLFPFGFGLSYTRFSITNPRLSNNTLAPGETLVAAIDIVNVGQRAGWGIVQFYIADRISSVARPDKELKGFAKVWLEPGETESIGMSFDMRALAFYDVAHSSFRAEAGDFELLAGFSSADIQARAPFRLNADWREQRAGSPTDTSN